MTVKTAVLAPMPSAEREHDDRGEAGPLAHQAQRVAEILQQHVGTPLLAEEKPGVGQRAPTARDRAMPSAVRQAGELRFPLGAELAAAAAGRERDTTAMKRRAGQA